MLYNFEWDPVKALTNAKKHDVTFEQATGVFKDPMALTLLIKSNPTMAKMCVCYQLQDPTL